jgi:hypothetical protein
MLKTASSLINSLFYAGTWNAATNTPTLTSGVGVKNTYYIVSTAGTTNLDGISSWNVGDWAIFNGTTWQKILGGETETFANITVTGLTGYMYANGNSAVTASTTIPVARVTGAVPNTTYVLAGTNLTGGGALTGNVTINNPYNGTVTNVATGTGLTGGPITSTGTISIANTTVTAGTYGSNGAVSQVVINAQGQVTSASNVGITIPVANVTGAVANTVNVLAGTGLSGGGALTGNVTLNLANTTVVAQTYGNANSVSQVVINAQGQVTSASNLAISINAAQINTTIPNSGLTNSSTTLGNTTLTLGSTATSVGNLTLNNVTIPTGSINAQVVNHTSTTSSTATFATSSLPLVPAGYIQINLNGTVVKVPYYAV